MPFPLSKTTRHYGALTILPTGDVQINSASIELAPAIKATLLALIEDAGDLVTRRAIADRTMRPGYGGKSSRSVDISISRLRTALGGEGWRIQNIYGKGYRFDPRPQRNKHYE